MTTIPLPDSPSVHEETARVIRNDLEQLAQGIRGFTLLTAERRRQLTTSGHVEEDFLRHMALLLDANPDVATPCHLTGAEIRDHLSHSSAYRGVGDELMLKGRMTNDTLLAERADIGERALRGLKIARNINTPAGRESLVPHLESIDRDFSRGRRKRAPVRRPEDPGATRKPEPKPEPKQEVNP
jgi:hypothetical protein